MDEKGFSLDHFNDPSYWDGTGNGYRGEGYGDFEVNRIKAAYIASTGVKRVLDVGCAYGFLVKRLLDLGIDAWGVDVSTYAIDHAPSEVKGHLVQGRAWELPFPDGSFDLIVSFGMLEHVPPGLRESTLLEMKRVARRGILGITLSSDPCADEDSSHNLQPYRGWRSMMPDGYELFSDSTETWVHTEARKVTVVAPTIYPVGKDGYGGIERLVVLFLRGLKEAGYETACICADGSVLPRGVARVSAGGALPDFLEPGLEPTIRSLSEPSRCYLDFSHSKPVAKVERYEAYICPIWHDPYIMQPPEPGWNVVALSEWQARRYRDIYKRDCQVLDPICGDPDYFTLGEAKGDYLLFIGKLHPDKGCLEAIEASRSLRQRLHIIGPVTGGDPVDYVQAVLGACDGVDIVYEGEVSESRKRSLIQGAKALVYPVSYPPGQGEAHSHKMVEVMLCGVPCIAYDQGAMCEVIDEGVTGHVIPGRASLMDAIKSSGTLDRVRCREKAFSRWSYRNVIARWMPVIESVARGERW